MAVLAILVTVLASVATIQSAQKALIEYCNPLFIPVVTTCYQATATNLQ